jgi:hypothetical protein
MKVKQVPNGIDLIPRTKAEFEVLEKFYTQVDRESLMCVPVLYRGQGRSMFIMAIRTCNCCGGFEKIQPNGCCMECSILLANGMVFSTKEKQISIKIHSPEVSKNANTRDG